MTTYDPKNIDLDSTKFEVLTLTSGAYSDYRIQGNFVVPIGFDWKKYMELFFIKRYREEAAKKSDYAHLCEADFIGWLQDQKLIRPVSICEKYIELPEPEVEYEPEHWPTCPKCKLGRGEPEVDMSQYYIDGEITYSNKCTSCDHEWGFITRQTKSA